MALPDRMPTIGQIVIYTHGDPMDVGGQRVDLPLLVVEVSPDGRVAGQAFLPPGAGVQTAQGVMPLACIPAVASYSAERKMAHWRWPAAPEAKTDAPPSLLVPVH